MAGHAVGRDAFLENEIIIPVSKLFDDPVDIARKNAHKVRFRNGCEKKMTKELLLSKMLFDLGNGNDC